MDPKRLVIIDGYSLLYRAFFATRFLSTSDGRPTNALYGFSQMLFNLLEKIQPDAIVVALDAPGKNFRHAQYAEYKGTRKEVAEELRVQFPVARDLIAALGIPSFEVTGYEADDIVGTISRLAEENGYLTTIVTGDLDSLQLVDKCVSVLTMKLGVTDTVTYDEAGVFERWGVTPIQVPDFKAIKGDTSDNIPGVPGIGDKGGAELIQTFGSVEGILDRFEDVPPKYAKKIEPVKEQLKLSKSLATIDRHVPLEYDFQPFVLSPDQLEAAKAWLEAYEFKSLHRRSDKVLGAYLSGAVREAGAPIAAVELESITANLTKISGADALQGFVGDSRFALYLAAPPARDLFDDPERVAYVAKGLEVAECPEADAFQLLCANPERAILHDAKVTYKRMAEAPAAPGFDTALAAFVLQSGRSAYSLRDLVQGYLDVQPATKPEDMAASLFTLQPVLQERLEKEEQLRVLLDIELPLIPILTQMEKLGIRADRNQLREFSKALETEIARVTAHVYELAGQEFSIGSPKQLGDVLFEKMQIPGAQKTKTGGYGTGVEILSQLAAEHEIAREVLNWRELTKLKSTYADALEKLIRDDGRIHTTYNQMGAATGRLSSNDPNLQNIPIRTELGRGIRKAFRAAEGYRLLSLDYSQIELRVLAHMCQEPALTQAFEDREDVHTVTAQAMFGLGDDPPSKEQRRLAKMLNYAVLYGVSEWGLAQQLGGGFSVAEAKELIKQYNERFPSVKAFTDGIVQEARSKGFTRTLMGRRRYFPDIHASKLQDRKSAERQAMNAPIQGTAADMLKLAMIQVAGHLEGSGTRMLLNVHDELVFEVPNGQEGVVEPIRNAMENALPLDVPVEVDAKIGADWNDMIAVPRP